MTEDPSSVQGSHPPGFPPERCALYLAGNEGAPPREHLVRAVERRGPAAPQARALDIGCGPGREALFLAQAGYEVVALDPYPEMLERVREAFAREGDAVVAARLARLERATLEEFAPSLEPSSFDLVHAGFVLPFVLPARFDECFAQVAACLRPGGILCCQFFGPEDEFIRAAAAGTMSSHTRSDVERLLEPFDILDLEEVNRQGRIGKGRDKWWHVFHATARRR